MATTNKWGTVGDWAPVVGGLLAGGGGGGGSAPAPIVNPAGIPMSAGYSALPYQGQLGANVNLMGQRIGQVQNWQIPEYDLRTVRNNAREAAASRGLTGPMAAAMEAESQARATMDYGRYREATLTDLLDRQNNLMGQMSAAEEARRDKEYARMYQIKMMQAQARAQAAAQAEENKKRKKSGLFRTLGGVAGGALGFVGSGFNPAGAMAGYALGTGAGELGSHIF